MQLALDQTRSQCMSARRTPLRQYCLREQVNNTMRRRLPFHCMNHTMYDTFYTGIQASSAYVKNHFHYNDPSDVNSKKL